MSNASIILERTYNARASCVWKALTDATLMKEWYFDIPGFKAEVGFEFQFTGGTEAKQYLHLCRITEIIPERKLSHTWRYDGYEGNTEVSMELFPEGDNTRLKLTHSGLHSLPKEPDFAASNFNAGWNHILGTSLKEFLEKTRPAIK